MTRTAYETLVQQHRQPTETAKRTLAFILSHDLAGGSARILPNGETVEIKTIGIHRDGSTQTYTDHVASITGARRVLGY